MAKQYKFTDEDLKYFQIELNESCSCSGYRTDCIKNTEQKAKVIALLSRLEAAEEVCQCVFAILDEQHRPRLANAFNAWYKVSGK